MTALTADINLTRRGPSVSRNEFGYPVKAGEKIFRGSLIGLNVNGSLLRLQTATPVVFAGIADRNFDNTASAGAMPFVVALKGTWAITVPGANFANIGAPVYGVDDGTVTLTQNGGSTLLQVGTLVGIDNGQTFVSISGS